ncbi:MAG: formate dehydrogenase accessory sulfurtransferase FdhD [Alphaproteobacteria bacterium]|nr:formate dehydrogenase accessory sulfurtransferase FdhD [Alphaproteobacteria bacterium]
MDGSATTWLLPEEVPVAIMLNSQSYAVMMATPADLEDFAVGFALSEGLVAHASHVANVLAMPSGDGFSVDLAIDEDHLIRTRMVKRSMEGRVGCGLCGIEELADAIRMPQSVLKGSCILPAAMAKAFEALPGFQPMNAVNRTVHAAAWCNEAGNILLGREDVGRHNALDKLIGAMARGHITPDHGFVLMSSRCSFELVQKCATVGISALATISAPTALALKLARQAHLQLAALSKHGIMIFDGETDGNV